MSEGRVNALVLLTVVAVGYYALLGANHQADTAAHAPKVSSGAVQGSWRVVYTTTNTTQTTVVVTRGAERLLLFGSPLQNELRPGYWVQVTTKPANQKGWDKYQNAEWLPADSTVTKLITEVWIGQPTELPNTTAIAPMR